MRKDARENYIYRGRARRATKEDRRVAWADRKAKGVSESERGPCREPKARAGEDVDGEANQNVSTQRGEGQTT